jgi:hypothetical protein
MQSFASNHFQRKDESGGRDWLASDLVRQPLAELRRDA